MTQQIPPGQGPIDPRSAFAPPPAPGGYPPAGGVMPPPPGYRPPPMFYPPPPPTRRGGVGRALFLVVLILMLGGSLLLNLLLGASIVGDSFDHGVNSTVLTSGDANQQIAVVPIDGVITDATRAKFERFMRHVDEDKSIKALVLEIDSPGGEVTPSDEIYSRIMKFKQDHPGIPVAASMRAMATSGAYYAACGADHLVAEQTTITGSIGVLWPRYNVADLMQKWGVKDKTIVSTGTPYKAAGSPFQTSDEKTEQYLQGLVDTAFRQFKSVVGKSRRASLKPGIDEIANGKAYTAQEALANGLVDELGYLDAAVTWAATNAHLSKPTVVKYEEHVTLLDRLPFAQSQLGSFKSQGVNTNGVNVNVDRQVIDSFAHPRMQYLWGGNY
ncbi:MAG TPA: signal peptide peptidase SppA [Tepidisphaeraceae bacterium]|jgi:protease-4